MRKLIKITEKFLIANALLFVFINAARMIVSMAEDVSNDIFTMVSFTIATLFILSLLGAIVYLVLPQKSK